MKVPTLFSRRIQVIIPLLLAVFLIIGCDNTGTEEGTREDPGAVFDSGFLGPGDTFSYTFEEEGTIPYYCRSHEPDMTGEVNVQTGAAISGQDTVEMSNLSYNPADITVAPNTTIVWINRENPGVDNHTVTSGNPPQDGGNGGYEY